jgi:hypothetical protein
MGIRRREEHAHHQHLTMSVITAVTMLAVIVVVGFCDWSVFMSEQDKMFREAVRCLGNNDPKGAIDVCERWQKIPGFKRDERFYAVMGQACWLLREFGQQLTLNSHYARIETLKKGQP